MIVNARTECLLLHDKTKYESPSTLSLPSSPLAATPSLRTLRVELAQFLSDATLLEKTFNPFSQNKHTRIHLSVTYRLFCVTVTFFLSLIRTVRSLTRNPNHSTQEQRRLLKLVMNFVDNV